jgi:ribonuclease Z
MEFTVRFVGTAGSAPTPVRGLPALLVRYDGYGCLIDCGEGTQRQLMLAGDLGDIDDVFITHLHDDHWLGLPGLIKTLRLQGRTRPLRVHGPTGLTKTLGAFGDLRACTHELKNGESVRRGRLLIESFAVAHKGIPAYGYALTEDDAAGALDVEAARALGIISGPDFGRLKRGETVNGVAPEQVLGQRVHGRKIVVSGDTIPCKAVSEHARAADLLIHEATFAADESTRALRSGHSTSTQAAQTALSAGVDMLALTHLSARYTGGELRTLRAQARAVFANAVIPSDFDLISIPLRHRGRPRLLVHARPPISA